MTEPSTEGDADDPIPRGPINGRAVTVGELRDKLDGLDGDTLVAVARRGSWNWAYHVEWTTRRRDDHPMVVLEEEKRGHR